MTHHHWQDPERDDGERFELLYRRYFRVVLGYALARLEPERAKDVAAETFLIAWRRLRDVPDEPVGWLLAVARKVIAGQLRADTRRGALRGRIAELGDNPCPPSDPADVVARRQAALSALSRLGPLDREVLMLTAWDGLPPEVAAEALGISRISFAVRLHRARRRLAAGLTEEDGRRSGPARRDLEKAITHPGEEYR